MRGLAKWERCKVDRGQQQVQQVLQVEEEEEEERWRPLPHQQQQPLLTGIHPTLVFRSRARRRLRHGPPLQQPPTRRRPHDGRGAEKTEATEAMEPRGTRSARRM